MSYVLRILGKFIFFEDVQMTGKSILNIFKGIKVTKNPKACGSILEQSLVCPNKCPKLTTSPFLAQSILKFAKVCVSVKYLSSLALPAGDVLEPVCIRPLPRGLPRVVVDVVNPASVVPAHLPARW